MTELFERLSEIFAIVNAEYRALDKADKEDLKRELPNNNNRDQKLRRLNNFQGLCSIIEDKNNGDKNRIPTNRPDGAENRMDRINLARKLMKGDKNDRD